MLQISPIPAFNDNYIWLLTKSNNAFAIVVDPGDATPVLKTLSDKKLKLAAILLTHHHHDHVGGTAELLQHFNVPVYGGINENISFVSHPIQENDQIYCSELDLRLSVLDIPGHTLGHVAFLTDHAVFCGDTLFTGGCGRIFEGTAEQLFTSLNKLQTLADDTFIYCGHEYTLNNLRFATLVEPSNAAIHARLHETEKLRSLNLPTVPATLALEKQTNPFLRCEVKELQKSVEIQSRQAFFSFIETFRLLRKWKDQQLLK